MFLFSSVFAAVLLLLGLYQQKVCSGETVYVENSYAMT
jgi:hypothetical protein